MGGVCAAVVAHRACDLLGQGVDVAYQVLGRLVGVFGAVDRLVEFVDVGLVVLGVVDLHRLRVDVRLERVVGVGKFGEGVGHFDLLSGKLNGYCPTNGVKKAKIGRASCRERVLQYV